jgi:hypothetical protein
MSNKKSGKKAVSPLNGARIPEPGPGRPPGSKNKFTNLKTSFLDVFQLRGGTEGLAAWTKKSDHNLAMFYSWIVRMLPADQVLKVEQIIPKKIIVREYQDTPDAQSK